jgi:hypothetical protein
MMLIELRASIAIGLPRRPSRRKHTVVKARVGNLSGNPGAATRRYGTGLDETGAAAEQPGWSWVGPAGGLGPTRNRKVVGSNPTSGSTNQQLTACSVLPRVTLLALIIK